MPTKQRCPKCNQLNELEAQRCAFCRAPLVQACPRCGTRRPWYVQRCPQCEARADDAQAFTDLFREAPTGRLHGRYVLRDTLATGRVSAVYRATDATTNTTVAVKELSAVALFRAEERRQAAAALQSAFAAWAQLAHPALPHLLEMFSERDKYYVVLEFVDGWSLARVIAERRLRIAPDLARNWGAQLCALLQYLHSQVPPRYLPFLSPGHVLVTPAGQVKVVDLGLTQLFSPGSAGPYGSVRGYAAPELESGPPSPQADVFAVGRTLYALLVGRLLESGAKAPPLNQAVPGISSQLVKAIAQAAHREPMRRFASAGDLGHALWDESYGPLAPTADWATAAGAATWSTVPDPAPMSRSVLAAAEPTMADLGYERDARYGPREAPPPAQAAPTPPEASGRLSVYPHEIALQNLQPSAVHKEVLTVRNTGEGELVGQVVSHVGWLSAPRQVFRVAAGKQARVVLTVRSALLPAGHMTEPQAVSVETTSGRQWVSVSAEIVSGPLLQVEQALLDFGTFQGDEERTLSLTISNLGRQDLAGSVASRVPWLLVRRADFRLAQGQETRVAVVLLPGRLPRGQQTASEALVIDSDGGQQRVEARAWHTAPRLDLGANHMDFADLLSGEVTERYLYVSNTGDAPLQGTMRSLLPWLQVYPQEFVCAPGEMVQVTVIADGTGLADGLLSIPQALRAQTNAGAQTLSLRLRVRAPRLVLGLSELDFGTMPLGEERERPLPMRNEGSAPLQAELRSLVPWLVVPEGVITCEAGQEVSLPVRATTASFTRGQEVVTSAALRIASGHDMYELAARMVVLQPALRVEPAEVDFGYIERSQPEIRTLSVANEGTGSLAWNAQTDAPWVEVTPTAGVCGAGESQTIQLAAYSLGLEAGAEVGQAVLVINSDGGRAKIPLQVALAAPVLASDTSVLDLGSSVNRQNLAGSFRVYNHGLGTLRGTLSADRTWLVLGRASFECATGRSVEIEVSTDMEEFAAEAGYGSALVTVLSNGGTARLEVVLNASLTGHVEVPQGSVTIATGENQAAQGRLSLHNSGLATAHVTLRASTSQLVLARDVCDIKPGKSVRVALRWEGPLPTQGEEPYIEAVSGTQQLRMLVQVDGPPDTAAAS
jgi:serine/threonine protein kinase